MSSDLLAVLIGIAIGVAASIPTALLVAGAIRSAEGGRPRATRPAAGPGPGPQLRIMRERLTLEAERDALAEVKANFLPTPNSGN